MGRKNEVTIDLPVTFVSKKYPNLIVMIKKDRVYFQNGEYTTSDIYLIKQLITNVSYGSQYSTPNQLLVIDQFQNVINVFGYQKAEIYKKIYPPELASKVSIVIGTWQNPTCIRECLESIYKATPEGYEVIVVDNATDPESKRIIAHYKSLLKKNMQVLVNPENNKSFSQFNNEGAELATRPYVLFLNDDTVVQAYWLESMVALLESKDDVGMVGKKTLKPNMTPFQHAEGNMSGELEIVFGHCILLRKADAHFDPKYKQYGWEDFDLCSRLKSQGKRIMCERVFPIIHKCSQSTRKLEGYATVIAPRNRKIYETTWNKH